MAKGRLALVVGPSGAGKDTLIGRARAALAHDPRFVFARRVITRDAIAELEDHDTVSREAFAEALARGEFALSWEAHGLCYGVPAAIENAMTAGAVVVCNGSRRAISAARARYPDCAVFLITASRGVRAARLAGRGRETEAEVAARLAREVEDLPPEIGAISIDNSGVLEDSVERFLTALRGLALS